MKYILLLLVVACNRESEIRAKVWRGGNHEITRDLTNGQEEYLPTDDPKFLKFRCMHERDADALIRAALRDCKPSLKTKQ